MDLFTVNTQLLVYVTMCVGVGVCVCVCPTHVTVWIIPDYYQL